MNLEEAIANVYKNNSILLLGAGFSVESLNVRNEKMPTGGGLASLLSANLGVPDKYPLSVVSSTYLARRGSTALELFLRDTFTAKTITPDQTRIAMLPWRRVYTLNYDDIIEKIYSEQNKSLSPLNYTDHVRARENAPQYIHLHGELHSGKLSAEELLLSTESYNSKELRSGWFGTFRADVELSDSIIVIGCSMSDLHLSEFFFRDPIVAAKTFFIEQPDVDDIWADNLRLFGQLEPIGVPKLADLVARTGRPATKPRTRPIAFELAALPSHTRPPSGDDLFDLLLLGEVKADVIPALRPSDPPNYIMWRDDADTILEGFDKASEPVRCVIHSDLGNGKSIILSTLKFALLQRGWTVLTLKVLRDIMSADVEYLSSLANRVVIFAEDIFRANNQRDIRTILMQFPRFSFVGTCRTSAFDLQGHEIHHILGDGYDDYDVNNLSNRECDQIVELFDNNGLWGADSRLRVEEKRSILTGRCAREFRSVILDRFNSTFMRKRIDSVFRSIPDGRVKHWLLVLLILELCGFEPSPYMIRNLCGYSPTRRDLDSAGDIREFIDGEGQQVRIRSSVLASLLVKEMYKTEEKTTALIQIAKSCASLSTGRDSYAELLKFTYRPAILGQLFGGPGYIDAAKVIFDGLKEIDDLKYKSLFWLQYAVMLTNEREYFGAKIIFDTAYGRAHGSDFDTFQVDNQFARYLLESRLYDSDNFSDPFFALTEAHKRLRAQILKDRASSYPYRVAEIYPDFAAMNWTKFDPKQKVVSRRLFEEMLDFIAKAPMRYRAQKLAETRVRLEEFLDGVQ